MITKIHHRQEAGALNQGQLWIVATPIGNLEDFSPRGARVLREVDVVAAEDTRHTRKLLTHFGIAAELISLHEHNESERTAGIIKKLQQGKSVALVSDAGTPLIADPGFTLVREARAANIPVAPVPGACALIAALSVAGLATGRFHFEGFLPAKTAARRERLNALREHRETLVFYESPRRVTQSLRDMALVLGDREAALCRELTKLHETVWPDTLQALTQRVAEETDKQRGECVIVVQGAPENAGENDRLEAGMRLFELLRKELAPGKAASIAARFTGCRRNALYR